MGNFKHINLEYLNEMSEGNQDLVRDLITMFIRQVPIFNDQLENYYQSGDYMSLGKLAHKIKSSVAMMGISELTTDMKVLEDMAKRGINAEKYPQYISKFKAVTHEAVDELQVILEQL